MNPHEFELIRRGDYQTAYLSLFRRLVESKAQTALPQPAGSELPVLDEDTLLARANGNPWQLARLLGAWIARQQGYGQLGRFVTLDGAEYRLFPVSRPAQEWPAENPRHWFFPLWPVPRFLPLERLGETVIEIDFAHLLDTLERDIPSQRIKIFAAEFCDRVKLDLKAAPGIFHCTGLLDPATRWRSIESALEQAREWRAHIVLMPELSVTAEMHQRLVGWLRQNKEAFKLVIAGSFHQDIGQGNHVNRCVLFRGNGLKLGEFDKWMAYTSHAFGKEKITPGGRLLVINTTAGLWLPAICLDFLQRNENRRELHPEFPWNRISGDLLLVASMGHESTVKGHQARAAALTAEFYPRVVVANITPESDGRHPGFVQEAGAPRSNLPPHSMWPPLYSV